MSHPYPKHDDLLKRDLSAPERLAKQRAYLRSSIKYLEQSIRTLERASDQLTEDELQKVCDAVDSVFNASANIAFLGDYGYEAKEVKTVSWNF